MSTLKALSSPAAPLVKIRTVTTGITLKPDVSTWAAEVERAASFNAAARLRFEEAGYQVQTTRLSTNSFEEYVDVSQPAAALEAIKKLNVLLVEHGVSMFNAGPARSVGGTELAVELVKLSTRISCSAQVPAWDISQSTHVARAMLRIAAETERGEGNFQFCASFNMQPGVPFFPAAYHQGESSFAIGCETSEVLAAALPAASGDLSKARKLLQGHMEQQLLPIENLAMQISSERALPYAGIDASIAPSPDATPITQSFESLGLGCFGAAGTLAVCALVTSAIKQIGVKLCGYTGLMLPPLEDTGLAQRANEGCYDIQDLLTYSAVCGIGLDTVPIPGAVRAEALTALFLDIAALAFRLQKPLSARLFPTPGKAAGEMTEFQNPNLCNACVFEL